MIIRLNNAWSTSKVTCPQTEDHQIVKYTHDIYTYHDIWVEKYNIWLFD